MTAFTEPPASSASSSTLPNTFNNGRPGEPCGLCGPVLPSLVTPTVSFKDTAAASSKHKRPVSSHSLNGAFCHAPPPS